MKITLTPEESEKLFHDALCNAVGTNYMDSYGLEFKYKQGDYDAAQLKLKNPCLEDVFMQILRDGKTLTFKDVEGDGEYTRSITLKDVHDKVCLTPARHLLDAIEETGDVVTADVLLQTVFFDEVVFG